MLNPNLNLNAKLFDNPEKVATREGFGQALVRLGKVNPDIVVLTADLKESTKCEEFAKAFPNRFFEVGVAEQNLAAVAAGLGVSGKVPFIASYSVFSPGKNWETIRTTIVYNKANVKIAGHHAGIITGPDGATHQATEDLALTQSLPGLSVFIPCDAIEARKMTVESAEIEGPVYLRYSREKTPLITTEETPSPKGKVTTFWTSERPQVTIFTTGHMVYYALLAAKTLGQDGIQSLVINVSSLKPLDEEGIIEAVKKTGCGVTVEDHQITGGLGSTISQVLAKNTPAPLEFIGLRDVFGQSGEASELIKEYHMDEESIAEAAKKAIKRKVKS